MENNEQNAPDKDKTFISSQDPSGQNTETHEEEGGTDYAEHGQGGQGAKSTDGDENSSHDQGNEESIAGREDS
jgi:hypothetical protein